MKNYVRFPLVLGIVCSVAGLGLAITFCATIGKIEERQEIKRSAAIVTVFFNAQPVETFWNNYAELDLDADKKTKYIVAYKDEARKQVLGYAAEGTFQGYSSKVVAMAGVAKLAGGPPNRYRILGVRIISQNETPGLGAQCNQVFSDETLWSSIWSVFSGDDGAKGPEPTAEQMAALGSNLLLLPRPAFENQFTGKVVTVADGAVSGLQLDKASWPQVKSGAKLDDVAAITGATITSNAAVEAVKNAILKIDGVLGKALAR